MGREGEIRGETGLRIFLFIFLTQLGLGQEMVFGPSSLITP